MGDIEDMIGREPLKGVPAVSWRFRFPGLV